MQHPVSQPYPEPANPCPSGLVRLTAPQPRGALLRAFVAARHRRLGSIPWPNRSRSRAIIKRFFAGAPGGSQGPPNDQRTWHTIEVGARRTDYKACGSENRRHRIDHSGAELYDDVRPWRNEPPRVDRNPAIRREPVCSPVERQLRIELAHLGIEPRPFPLGHIGRIGDDEIEAAAERGAE